MTHAKDKEFSHPFKCLICIKNNKTDKRFTRKSSLKRHCISKHKNINLDEAEWINNQSIPKWDKYLKKFIFYSTKNKIKFITNNNNKNNQNVHYPSNTE